MKIELTAEECKDIVLTSPSGRNYQAGFTEKGHLIMNWINRERKPTPNQLRDKMQIASVTYCNKLFYDEFERQILGSR